MGGEQPQRDPRARSRFGVAFKNKVGGAKHCGGNKSVSNACVLCLLQIKGAGGGTHARQGWGAPGRAEGAPGSVLGLPVAPGWAWGNQGRGCWGLMSRGRVRQSWARSASLPGGIGAVWGLLRFPGFPGVHTVAAETRKCIGRRVERGVRLPPRLPALPVPQAAPASAAGIRPRLLLRPPRGGPRGDTTCPTCAATPGPTP